MKNIPWSFLVLAGIVAWLTVAALLPVYMFLVKLLMPKAMWALIVGISAVVSLIGTFGATYRRSRSDLDIPKTRTIIFRFLLLLDLGFFWFIFGALELLRR